MDRKSIAVVVACVVLLLLWEPLSRRLYPPTPVPPGSTNSVAGGTNFHGTNVVATPPAGDVPAAPVAPVAPVVAPGSPEELITLENTNARYVFTSHGGGLKSVELKAFQETIASAVHKKVDTNKLATLNGKAPVAAMTLLGGPALQGDGIFKLTKTTNGLRAEKLLTNGIYIVKDFTLSTNFLVNTTVRLENRTAQNFALPVQEWVLGTATPMSAHDDKAAQTMGVYWYNGNKSEHIQESWFANATLGCFPGTRRPVYEGGNNDVIWAAVHNQFFAMMVIPKEKAPKVVSRHLELPPPTEAEKAADPRAQPKPVGFQTALVYPATVLEAGKSIERHFDIFAGPKEYRNLELLGVQYKNNLEDVMNFGGFFGWFAKMLLLSMNKFYHWGLSYGWAIVAITVLIKVLFWPLTAASTRSMKRMSELQPQMKAIQEKYKDDPTKMNQKTMEFMRENKVNPLGGCLPLLLQMPVFFGFYTMLQGAIELRGASFLWAKDLASPDTLFIIPGLGWIPFLGIIGVGLPFNLLPLLMGATSLWQASMTPPSPGMDPMQQKMMKYMPLMMVLFLYNFSAGLALYWTVQNLLSVAQTKLTKTTPKNAAAPVVIVPPKKKK